VSYTLGGEILVTGNDVALTIARLQLAINRVIRGGRSDTTVFDGVPVISSQAKTADQVKESGVLGNQTNISYRSATLIVSATEAPTSLTTISQVEEATRILNAKADERGYPTFDTVKLKAGSVGRLFGGEDGKKGLPVIGELTPVKLAIVGAMALGVGFVVYQKVKR